MSKIVVYHGFDYHPTNSNKGIPNEGSSSSSAINK